jgi:Family of unknown function (DUF6263)
MLFVDKFTATIKPPTMKKIGITLLGIFCTTFIFSQAGSTKPVGTGKIMLTPGQKIIVESSISMDADLSMGMQMSSTSTNENLLEAKNSTDKNYILSNTLTKVKVNMNMMGQPTSYDSEKKEDNNSDIAKTFEDKLNKPVDITIDNATGKAVKDGKKETKKESDEENPMSGLLDVFAQSSDDAVVTGAFELIPAGKNVGESWQDSTITKDVKTIRNYTLISITGNEALVQLDAVTTAKNKLDVQGMEMEFKSETKSTGEIITDITSGQVKKRTTKADITGSIQLMGQDVPITAKATSTNTYK